MEYREFVEVLNKPAVLIMIGVVCAVLTVSVLELYDRWSKK